MMKTNVEETEQVYEEPEMPEAPKQVNGADVFIQTLKKHQVEVVFGYPGGAVLPIYDALYKNPIQTYSCTS